MTVLRNLLRTATLFAALLMSASLMAQSFLIQGTVYGGGSPLPGATVTIFKVSDGSSAGASVTGAGGAYSVTASPGTYNLLVQPPPSSGFASASIPGIAVTTSNITQNVALLSQAVTYSGVLRLPSGAPIQGVQMTLLDQASGAQVGQLMTGADGAFAFPVSAGTYKVNLYGHVVFGLNYPGHPYYFMIQPILSNLVVAANLAQDLTIPFAALTGTTTDNQGVPVGGVELQSVNSWTSAQGAFFTFGYTTGSVLSDASGNYLMWVMPQTYAITLVPPAHSGFAQTVVPGVTVAADTSRNFALQPAVTYSGVLRLPNGAPIQGVQMTLLDQATGAQVGQLMTGADGAFAFPVSAGTYKVNLYGHVVFGLNYPGHPYYFMIQPILSNLVVAADLAQDLTIPFAALSGTTTDSQGVPVGGVELQSVNSWTSPQGAFCTFGYTTGSVLSDASGNYLMWVMPQTYAITLVPPAHSGFAQTVVPGVVVAADTARNFVLQPAVTYSGVLRLPNGAPIQGVQMTLLDQASGAQAGQIMTGADGAFAFPVTPGTYKVNLYGHVVFGLNYPGHPYYFMIQPILSNLVVTADLAQDLTLPFVALSGRTTDNNGVPVGGVELQSVASWTSDQGAFFTFGYTTGSILSDASGSYLMWVLPQTYAITIIPPAGSGFAQTPLSGVVVGGAAALNVVLDHPDTTPPIILAGPSVSAVTDTSAVVAWATDEPATGSLSYGTSNPPATLLAAPNPGTLSSVTLSGLSANTTYYLSASATDTSGNGPTVSKVVSFTTAPAPDLNPPVILEGPVISTLTDTTATVIWSTDKPSTGIVGYGTTAALGQAAPDPVLATSHRVTLTGLTASTAYSLQVSVTDAGLDGPTLSPVLAFTTSQTPVTTPPVIVQGPQAVNITATQATILWNTDTPSTSGVSWNNGTAYGLVTDPGLVTSHSVQITGLAAATAYSVTTSSTDAFGNGPTLSPTFTFTTQTLARTAPPVITEAPLVVNVTHQSAVIRWTTDEPADSKVSYGTTPALGQSTSRAALTQPHNMTLTGLNPSTLYYFSVQSQDAAGNGPTTLGPYTFTTYAKGKKDALAITLAPSLIYLTATSATVYWETNDPADSVVSYGPGQAENLQQASAAMSLVHQVTLVNLQPGQPYSLSVSSTDSQGQVVMADLSAPAPASVLPASSRVLGRTAAAGPMLAGSGFTTHVQADLAAPVLVSGPTVLATSDKLVVIAWTTDKIADSRLAYGLQGQPRSLSSGDIQQVTAHTVVLTNLAPDSTYQYVAGSLDASGNGPALSPVLTFTTLGSPDANGPVFTVAPGASALADTAAVLAWTTDVPATTQLLYGTSPGSLTQQAAAYGIPLSHTLALTSLSPGTTYYGQAVSTDCFGNVSSSPLFQFVTTGASGTANPTISGNAGVAGATLSYTNGTAQAATADAAGNYIITVPFGWTGTVTPSLPGYTFNPPSLSYTGIQAGQTAQDFTALLTPARITWATPAAITYGTALGAGQLDAACNVPGTFTYAPPAGTILNAGPGQSLTATFTPSDLTLYSATSASVALDVDPAPQTITFAPLPPRVVGSAPFTLQATASSGLPVGYASSIPGVASVNGSVVTLVGAGSTDITASQPGDANHLAAPDVIQTLRLTASPSGPMVVLSMLPDGAATSDPVLNVAGTALAVNGLQSLTVNGTPAAPGAGGAFVFAMKLASGPNPITVLATDTQQQTTTLVRTITQDSAGPVLAVTAPADNCALEGETVTVTGTVEPPPAGPSGHDPVNTVTCALNGGSSQPVSVNGTGFSFSLTGAAGLNTLDLTATTFAGKVSQTKRTFTCLPALALAITDPPEDVAIPLGTFLVKGTVAGGNAPVSVSLSVGGTTYAPAVTNGAFQQEITLNTDTEWQVAVTGTDSLLNSWTTRRFIFKVPDVLPATVPPTAAASALGIALGLVQPGPEDVSRYDVAPLLSGIPVGDGVIDIEDVVVLLRIASGLPN